MGADIILIVILVALLALILILAAEQYFADRKYRTPTNSPQQGAERAEEG